MDLRLQVIKKYVKKSDRILDVGCQLYTLHDDLIKEYSERNVWGLDIALKEETDRLFKGNAEHMPFDEDFFDAVIAGELIEHLENPEKFVKECRRVLKANGIAIITTPNIHSLFNRLFKNYEHREHKNLFDEQSLRNIFAENGLAIIHYSYLPYTLYSSPGKSATFGFLKRILIYTGRKFIHYLLPNRLKENLVLVAAKK